MGFGSQDNKILDICKGKFVKDGKLTDDEHKAFMELLQQNESILSKKQDINNEARTELCSFVESDYANKNIETVGREGVNKFNGFVGIKSAQFTTETFKQIMKYQKENSLLISGILSEEIIDAITSKSQKKEIEMNIDISKAENIKGVLDIAISSVINEMLSNIESQGGISFQIDEMYVELLSVLDNIEKNLPKDHIFKKDIGLIRQNFLLPVEKGKKLIEASLNLIKSKPGENISEELEYGYLLLRSGVQSIFDFAKTKNESEIKDYIQEFKKVPIINNFLQTIPDFEDIFLTQLPNLINSIDKEKFLLSLDQFYNGTKDDFVVILEYKYGKREINNETKNKVTLNIVNKFGILLGDTINEKNSSQILSILPSIDFIKNNSLFSSIIDLLNSSNIKNIDKKNFTKKIIDIFSMAAQENISDEVFQNIIISFFDEVVSIGTKFEPEKLNKLFKEIQKRIPEKQDKKSFLSKLKEKLSIITKSIKSAGENFDFVGDIFKDITNLIKNNKKELATLTKKWIREGVRKSDIVNYLLKKGFFKGKSEEMVKVFIKEIKNILNIDLRVLLVDIRESYLNSTVKLNKFKYDKEQAKILSDNNGLIGKIVDKFIASGSNLVQEKIGNRENNFISKEEIINLIISDLRDILSKNKGLLIIFLKENGLIIKNKNEEKLVFDLLDGILSSPKLGGLISKIFTLFIKKNSGKTDIGGDISALLIDSFNSIKQNKEIIKNVSVIGVDLFYQKVLSNRENIDTFISIIKKNHGIDLKISDEKIGDIIQVCKKYIKAETIKQIISANQDLLDGRNISKDKIFNIVYSVYSKIDNKTAFLKEMLDTGIVSDLKNISSKNKGKEKNNDTTNIINEERLLKLNNAVFDTLSEKNGEGLGEIINTLIKDFGLGDLLKINICGQSLGKNIVLLLHSIGREKFGKILTNNIDLIKNIKNVDFRDNKQVLSFIGIGKEIISNIDISILKNSLKTQKLTKEEKLWIEALFGIKNTIRTNNYVIDRLVKSGLDVHNIQNIKRIDVQKITPQNVDDICSLIFDFVNYTGTEKVSQLINFYLDKLGFGQILKLNIFSRNFGDNVVVFLKSIGENNFSQVIKNNLGFLKQINKIPNLQEIVQTGEITRENKDIFMGLSKLGRELLVSIDFKEFTKGLEKKNLSKREELGLSLGENLQDIILKNNSKINAILSKGVDLFNLYQKNIKIKKGSIEAENIQKYGEELFDMINKIIKSFDEDKLKTYFNKQKIFGGDKKTKDTLSSYDKFKSNFIWNFIQNNILFTLKTGTKALFSGLTINFGDVADDYFRNSKNKDDFGDTILDVFLEKEENK